MRPIFHPSLVNGRCGDPTVYVETLFEKHSLLRATSTIPVVFVGINEPVAQGFNASMARPGGNITGLTQVDFFSGR